MFTAIKRIQEFQCIQYNGTNSKEILDMVGEYHESFETHESLTIKINSSRFWNMGLGDWVVQDSLGTTDLVFRDEFAHIFQSKWEGLA